MKTFLHFLLPGFGLLATFAFSPAASASGCGHRLGVGAGLVHIEQPSETDFEIGAEYECRMDILFGVGGFGNYIFSNPGITLLGAPEIFVHPLGGDFYVAGSPLLEFGSGTGTHLGIRLATRVPLPLGLFILVPSFAVDFINGTRIYWFGLGIAI
ncbi:MAG: hypothetical protein ACXVB9_08165 [Bdellovibrionota bacterium]